MTDRRPSPDAQAEALQLQARLETAFTRTLGDRLHALVVYGSAVDGSFIPGFSDLDVAVFIRGTLRVDDAIKIQAGLADLEPTPFAYIQTKFVDVTRPAEPTLVPGSFAVICGELPDQTYLYDAGSLRRTGQETLQALPQVLAGDAAAWAVAVGSARRCRLVRLMTTSLKPALRSLLVELGEPPREVWIENWNDLAMRWRGHDTDAANTLASLLKLLPPTTQRDEVSSGETILRLLALIEHASGSGI